MDSSNKVLSLQNVTMTYGNHRVLNGVNLEVERGQIIGYIGPNGAGKSTTVKIMLGMIQNYEGKVEIFGEDIASGDPSYKRRIGYVPEQAELYDNLTAMEYLAFTGELYGLDRNLRKKKRRSFWRNLNLETLCIRGFLHSPKGCGKRCLSFQACCIILICYFSMNR